MPASLVVPVIENLIIVVRGQRVILAADLASVYDVETRALNQAVKRNEEKFPDDFLIKLTKAEAGSILRSRSQSVILKRGQRPLGDLNGDGEAAKGRDLTRSGRAGLVLDFSELEIAPQN